MKAKEAPFWETKTLEELSTEEWESLCDDCAKCCLHKLEDVDSGVVYYTNVVCRYLDMDTGLCTDYEHRHELVPDCVFLTPEMVRNVNWLPKSCAYRRIAEGRGLAWWHPLVSGDEKSVRMAGISILGKAISEDKVDLADLEDMVVDWFE